MPLMQANGINIEYDLVGQGPPLVLIAGLGYERWLWHRLRPGLSRHFQVLTYDNRGVGGSDVTPGPYTAPLLADDLAGLLEGLGIAQTAVMGHSMGGFIAQQFVLSYPEKCSHLILSATNFGGPRHVPITQEALAILMDTSSDPLVRLRQSFTVSCAPGFGEREPEFLETWLTFRSNHPVSPVGYQAQMGIGLSLMSEEAAFENKLTAVDVPTLILTGTEDKVVPPGNAILLAEKISRSQTALIADSGHFYVFEQPETAVNVITTFLQENST